MEFEKAMHRALNPKDCTVDELEEAFYAIAEVRDCAQEGLARINSERQNRTADEVKRLRAEIAAKA